MKFKNFVVTSITCLALLPTLTTYATVDTLNASEEINEFEIVELAEVTDYEDLDINENIMEYYEEGYGSVFATINSPTGMHLKESPKSTSEAILTIPENAEVELLEDTGEWLLVSYEGVTGYLANFNLSFSHEDLSIYDDLSIYENLASNESLSTNEDLAQQILDFAKQHLGKPYIYASTNLNAGTDCSGFTYSVFRNFGINLGRSSRDQYLDGVSVSYSELMPGDLLFFDGGGPTINHVGIYAGNGTYIHSSSARNGVIISDLTTSYNQMSYYGARRVIK